MKAGLQAHLTVSQSDSFTLNAPMAIDAGKTVALLGPNGAGKSTAVQVLAGLLPLQDGWITLNGRVLDDPEASIFVHAQDRRVGVVFQDYVLFPNMSVYDNVGFSLAARGLPKSEIRNSVHSWLERLGLADQDRSKPSDLSGGQAQRVALARALIAEPDLLLLDEPLAALDVTTRAELRHVLADHLAAFPGPRLLITHDPTEAFLLADEIHVIEAGVITQTGSPDEIRLRPRTSYIADLAGSNLVAGTAADGVVALESHRLHVADSSATGAVLATIHPRAISVHRKKPEGSPRNSWQTTVVRVEHFGDRVRLRTGDPLPLTAEITPAAVSALGIAAGGVIWISIKATEIGIEAD